MRALAAAIGIIVGVMGAIPGPASAGDVLRPTVFQPNPFAMTPPPTPLGPRPAPQVPVGPPPGHRSPPVVIYPCCTTGYWAYQWVPTTSTTYVWVPGYVTEDGIMLAGGYQPQTVSSGYYQPVWVTGY